MIWFVGSASIVILSPSCTSAIGPAFLGLGRHVTDDEAVAAAAEAAVGDQRDILSPRPAPMIALVGVSISGMPGPPWGLRSG